MMREITERLQDADSTFLLNYGGLTVTEMYTLSGDLPAGAG